MSPTSFLGLPVELVCRVLAYLDLPDLLQCTLVSKLVRRIITNSCGLQYTIELAMHRMVSVLPGNMPPSLGTRLATLRSREHAWKHFQWKHNFFVDLPKPGSLHEFTRGVFARGELVDAIDGRLVVTSISFSQIPEPAGNHQLGRSIGTVKSWVHDMGGLAVVNFAMDPAQDLLVLVARAPQESPHSIHVYLRTISTNAPHPEAPVPMLSSIPRIGIPMMSVKIQIVDDLVALLCNDMSGMLYAQVEIWNWRVQPRKSCILFSITGICDFSLLSRDTLLAVKPGGFEVYEFKDPAVIYNRPIIKASYELPTLSEHFSYFSVQMDCNPIAGFAYNRDAHGLSMIPPLYEPRLEDRINVCTVQVWNPTTMYSEVSVFFVNTSVFLTYPAYPSASPLPPPIPWESWGPQHTRWFRPYLNRDRAMYGCRAVGVVSCETEDGSDRKRLRVRDFNLRSMQGEEKGWRRKVVSGESVTRMIGEINVVSSLPYTEALSEETFAVDVVMMDDRRLLLFKSTPDEVCNVQVLMV